MCPIPTHTLLSTSIYFISVLIASDLILIPKKHLLHYVVHICSSPHDYCNAGNTKILRYKPKHEQNLEICGDEKGNYWYYPLVEYFPNTASLEAIWLFFYIYLWTTLVFSHLWLYVIVKCLKNKLVPVINYVIAARASLLKLCYWETLQLHSSFLVAENLLTLTKCWHMTSLL